MQDVQTEIENRLATVEPQVEVLLAERAGPELIRLFIDHPDGVDLGLCERVTNHLRELLEEYSLEVSSPGAERPLSRPEHFRRFLGRRVRVRTREKLDGQRSFTGVLADADAERVALDLGGEAVQIPFASIHRSNLIPDGRTV